MRVAREIDARTTLACALAGRSHLESARGAAKEARTLHTEAESVARAVGLGWLGC